MWYSEIKVGGGERDEGARGRGTETKGRERKGGK